MCCVITCADVDIEIAPMLGLADKDVLVLRIAGPFVNAEAIALVESTIKNHRLCLVLVLGHERCDSLRLREEGPEVALDRRVAPCARVSVAASRPPRSAWSKPSAS